MNGFYLLSDGSVAYVTGANNISLPKGKTATAVIMPIGADGRIGRPCAYNYSDESDLVSGIRSICGIGAEGMLAHEGSAAYKALHRTMYNPTRFLETMSSIQGGVPTEPHPDSVTKGKGTVPKEKPPKEPKKSVPKERTKESSGRAVPKGTPPDGQKGDVPKEGTKGRTNIPAVRGISRTVTPYEVKRYSMDSPIFFIPSGNNRWIYPEDHDGRFILECTFVGDNGKPMYRTDDSERWIVTGTIDGRPIGKKEFERAYEASDYGKDMYREFCRKNGLKMHDGRVPYIRKPSSNKLEHFIPKGRESAIGKAYVPRDDRRGRLKKVEVFLSDNSYNIAFHNDSWEGVGGPAESLKDAEMNAIGVFDRRYAPSEFLPMDICETPFVDEYGEEICPNCGHGKFRKNGGLNECLICGCVSDPRTSTVHMDKWNHATFNGYRDRTERERYKMFPSGWDWTQFVIDGKKYEYTKHNFDSDRYNIFYAPEMEVYDRRCSKMINFNILGGLDRRLKKRIGHEKR